MIDIAFKMLLGERAKYAMLISGICFATILMTQGLALFFGLLSFSYATADNIRAPIWVVDPMVEQVSDNMPLRDTDVERVRSVEGIAWAAPLYVGNAQARLVGGGATKPVTLVGLDTVTLAGSPTRLLSGNIMDLRLPDSVIVDDRFLHLISPDPRLRLTVGDTFEMNDRRAVIVGIAKVAQGLGGATYVFTTWDRAKQFAPSQRKMLTHVLAKPREGYAVAEAALAIQDATGLQAVTESEFKAMSKRWMLRNSPIPFVVGVIVAVGLVVGVGVSGQTFYSFVLENTRHLGALKAMGVSNWKLAGMILVQALTVGFIGFGVGVGVMSLFFFAIPDGKAPLVMLPQIPVGVFLTILLICVATALVCVARVARIEPAIVFRA